jgi:hypothetical protein
MVVKSYVPRFVRSLKRAPTHRASAMPKLGMSSTAELVRYAIRKKLLRPEILLNRGFPLS